MAPESSTAGFTVDQEIATFLASGELLSKAWKELLRACENCPESFTLREDEDVIYVAFPSFHGIEYFIEEGSQYGEGNIQTGNETFSGCLKGQDDQPACVQQGALKLFLHIMENTDLEAKICMKVKPVIFVGHFLGGSLATLATLWVLGKRLKQSFPFCITFGCPLVGDVRLAEAVGRENWTGNFCHVLSKHDIAPQILLAPLESINVHLNTLLPYWNGIMTKARKDASDYFIQDAYTALLHSLKELDGVTNRSPYRPFGAYLFCSSNGAACIINSEAVWRMFHLTMQSHEKSSDETVQEHIRYGSVFKDIVQNSIRGRTIVTSTSESSYNMGISLALDAIGVGAQGINRGLASVAFRKQTDTVENLMHRVSSSNAFPRKHVIKALQDSNKKPDLDSSVSGNANNDLSQGKSTKLKKNKNYKHLPCSEAYKSISMPSDGDDVSDITDLEFSDALDTSEDEESNYTAFLNSFSKGLVNDQKAILSQVLNKLEAVRLHALALEQWNALRLKECHRFYRASATNLIHYVALRSIDICQLQEALSILGLSNIEGVNAHIMASLTSVVQILHSLTQSPKTNSERKFDNEVQSPGNQVSLKSKPISDLQSSLPSANGMSEEISLLAMKNHAGYNAELLFGPSVEGRNSRIMVTVGSEAADNEDLIYNLIKSGVNIIRINCAHDNPDVWRCIIKNVKSSSQMLEQPCRVLMDLAGPKLRIGPFKPGPNVKKIKPLKDARGVVISPALVWIAPPGVNPPSHRSHVAVVPVDDSLWIRSLEVGDVVKFCDARGKGRLLKITEKFPTSSDIGCWAECSETAYVESGTEFHVKRKKHKIGNSRVAELPTVQQYVQVKIGDLLVITRDPCLAPSLISNNDLSGPPKVTCSLGLLFDSVKPGEPIEFDDGKIKGVIRGVNISEICVEITHAGQNGSKLGAEKSINVPRSNLHFEGLTVKDLMDLDFIAANADLVGVSFVNDVNDVNILQQELDKRKLKNLGIVLKIETKGGFERLPLLLLQAMRSPNPLGVMIARGDLAVECGWEKLAEMQEEILSICEAAHIPSIWATQVLESLAKSGLPTRAEITDAAVGGRADCVMLNKGRHIIKAVLTLDSILRNTSMQQPKLKPVLKPLLFSSLF